MKRFQIAMVIVLAGLLVVGVAALVGTYHRSMTPKVFSEWNDSSDGKLSVSLTVDKTTFSPSESIIVRCAIKNNSDETLLILRPFVDVFYALSAGLHILGPDGLIQYQGAMKEYILGTGSFHELKAGMVIDETLELPESHLKGMGALGLYKISYKYISTGYPKQLKPDNFWEGNISSSVIHALVMNKKSNQPDAGDGK